MKRIAILIVFTLVFHYAKSQDAAYWFSKSDSIISDSHRKLESLDFERVKLLPIYDFTVDEVEGTIAFFENQNFQETIATSSNSLVKFEEDFIKLKIATGKKRIVLDQKLANLDYEFYKKGMQSFNKNNLPLAQELFEKSVETNYFYSLSHCMLAVIFAKNKSFIDAAEKINEAYEKTFPDKRSREELFTNAVKIKDEYFRFIDTFLTKEQFNQTLKNLESAETICQNLQIDCSEDINKRRSDASFGIYKAYLSVARKAISSNQPTFAEQYIAKAKNYQNENKGHILHAEEADELLLSMAEVYEEKGLMLMGANDYEEAIEHFNKALYFCKQNKQSECNENINRYIHKSKKALFDELVLKADRYLSEDNFENAEFYINKAKEFQKIHSNEIASTSGIDSVVTKLNYVQYKYLLGEGKYFIKKEDYQIALENLEAATKLENDNPFTRDTMLYHYKSKAAKPIIIDLLSTASLKAWAKEFELSEDYLQKGIQMQANYNLLLDEEINEKIKKVKKKLANN